MFVSILFNELSLICTINQNKTVFRRTTSTPKPLSGPYPGLAGVLNGPRTPYLIVPTVDKIPIYAPVICMHVTKRFIL